MGDFNSESFLISLTVYSNFAFALAFSPLKSFVLYRLEFGICKLFYDITR